MQIQLRKIADLSEDPANVRKHSERNIDSIVASLRRFNQQKPIVVDSNGVVRAGNGTLEAAKRLGWEEIQVAVSDLDSIDLTAYAIADNRTGELAEWDTDALKAAMDSIQENGVESTEVGFSAEDIDALAAGGTFGSASEITGGETTEPEIEDVEPEDPPEEPVTCLGDVWLCGEHRVLCGDSADGTPGVELASLVLTDPPYGVSGVQNTKTAKRRGGRKNDYDTFTDSVEYVASSIIPVVSCLVSTGVRVIITPGNRCVTKYPDPDSFGVFYQPASVALQSWGRADAQPILYYGRSPHGGIKLPAQSCSWTMTSAGRSESIEHPCPKPLKQWACLVASGSIAGDIVYDPFLGSGTTLIACEQLGRKCYGIEISPAYCDVIVRRWQTLTGKQATRESDGALFDDQKV